MRRKLYIYPLMTAVLMVLLSTMVMHHHHGGVICTVVEICQIDGHANDRHTNHHESDSENDACSIQQLHQFVVKSTTDNTFSSSKLLLAAILPQDYVVTTTNTAQPFADSKPCGYGQLLCYAIHRRGPPCNVIE